MTKAFSLGLGYYLHQYITPETLGREERISKRILTMVEQNYTRIREVGQYPAAGGGMIFTPPCRV